MGDCVGKPTLRVPQTRLVKKLLQINILRGIECRNGAGEAKIGARAHHRPDPFLSLGPFDGRLRRRPDPPTLGEPQRGGHGLFVRKRIRRF